MSHYTTHNVICHVIYDGSHEDLYAAYVAALDERRCAELPEVFIEECRSTLMPREHFERGLPLAPSHYEPAGTTCEARDLR